MSDADAHVDALAALSEELGANVPVGVDELSTEAITLLVAKIRSQKTHQRRALDEAITKGLDIVPAMLRGAVRRVLFKGG